jgi:hypothetical protein
MKVGWSENAISPPLFNRIVTSLAILSVSMPHYCMVYFFEFHCNYIGNCVCKNLHVIVLFGFFFISSIPTAILLIYTDDIFLSVFTDKVNDEKI